MASGIDPDLKALIEGSPLFDEKWYRREFSDVGTRAELVEKYLANPGPTPRRANALFDDEWYLALNEDVRASGMHPLQHYILAGASEGRRPSTWFDASWYLDQPGSDGATPTTALERFLTREWPHLTSAHPLFDPLWYLDTYRDVAESGLNPLVHFASWGAGELRNPNPWFDSAWYSVEYPDVASSGVPPFAHYVSAGWREGRRPHRLFDSRWYRERYGLSADQEPLRDYLHGGGASGRVPRLDDEQILVLQRARPTRHDPGSSSRSFPDVLMTVNLEEGATLFDSAPWRGGVRVSVTPVTDPHAGRDWSLAGELTHPEIDLKGPWTIDVDWLRWPLSTSTASRAARPDVLAACLGWMNDVQGRLSKALVKAVAPSAGGWVSLESSDFGDTSARASSVPAPLAGRPRVLVLYGPESTVVGSLRLRHIAEAVRNDGNEVLTVVLDRDRIEPRPIDEPDAPETGPQRQWEHPNRASVLTADGFLSDHGESALSGIVMGFRPDIAIVVLPACAGACRVLFKYDVANVVLVEEGTQRFRECAADHGIMRATVDALRSADEAVFASEADRVRWGRISDVSRGRVIRREISEEEASDVEAANIAVADEESGRQILGALSRSLLMPRAIVVPRGWL